MFYLNPVSETNDLARRELKQIFIEADTIQHVTRVNTTLKATLNDK